LGRPLKDKTLLKTLDMTPPKNLKKKGRIHRPQGERRKTNVTSVGNKDISSGNALKGRREDNSSYYL
jgi:hypothetical protein